MDQRTILRGLCVALVVVSGCASGGPSDRTATGSDRIIAGEPWSGDPAVVYIDIGGTGLCTGSLIAPRVVMTAKHCVIDESTGVPTPASDFHIGSGPDQTSGTIVAGATRVVTTPGASIEGIDIALIVLDRDTGLTPYPWAHDAPSPGSEIVGIGYGQTEGSAPGSSGAGVKYRGSSTVGDVTAAELETTGPLSCYGDSGGPGFIGGEVAGIVSRGTADTCEGGHTIYTRVDAFASMIESVIASSGDPSGTGTGCDPATDPTCCDPATDPSCTGGTGGGTGTGTGCDPATDPTCCDPTTDPSCDPGAGTGCDPATDPTCCDPYSDPSCDPGTGTGTGCDPATDPTCCDPATDPTCCDPATDPGCDPSGGYGGDRDGDGCPDADDANPDTWEWEPVTPWGDPCF